MDEYIKRSDAIKRFQEIKDSGVSLKDAAFLDGVMAVLDNVAAAEVAPVIYAKRIKTKKHRWKTYSNGETDFCAWDSGYCNGPQCIDCGEYFCIHCVEKDGGEEAVKKRLEKEDCEEKTVCSVCGRIVPEDAPYCHCGAKMEK